MGLYLKQIIHLLIIPVVCTPECNVASCSITIMRLVNSCFCGNKIGCRAS
ncbi:hypothetical protein PUN28_015259 [Cardiocondyla obscurior]|uniref:Nodule Cysteine-Rich (NCR) secreted peptide n=1 Tax=Cardiocondyla obscurior TaxID=286306 RepID=A0AAW2EZG6_9HYME